MFLVLLQIHSVFKFKCHKYAVREDYATMLECNKTDQRRPTNTFRYSLILDSCVRYVYSCSFVVAVACATFNEHMNEKTLIFGNASHGEYFSYFIYTPFMHGYQDISNFTKSK